MHTRSYSDKEQQLVGEVANHAKNSILNNLRSEVMMPALSSPIAQLQNMVAEGIAKTAKAVIEKLKGAAANDNEAYLRNHERNMADAANAEQKEVVSGVCKWGRPSS